MDLSACFAGQERNSVLLVLDLDSLDKNHQGGILCHCIWISVSDPSKKSSCGSGSRELIKVLVEPKDFREKFFESCF